MHQPPEDLPDDPVYRNSLRESLVALASWFVCGVYAITYCYLNGYGRRPEEIETYLGIPGWVLFGIFLPWVLCNVFAWWYCFRFIKEDDLEPPRDEEAVE